MRAACFGKYELENRTFCRSLQISNRPLRVIEDVDFSEPSPIQSQAIPTIIEPADPQDMHRRARRYFLMLKSENEQVAELYFHTPGAGYRKAISYRRFASMMEALSFVMNEVTPRDRSSCFLEFGEQRLGYRDIKKLYRDERVSNGQASGGEK